MPQRSAEPAGRVRLAFDPGQEGEDAMRRDLSAAVAFGRDLWTANDEYARVERLTRLDDGSFGDHRPFWLHHYLDLPEGAGEEMDIEGLAIEDGYLWITGSHSRTRKKPKHDEHDADEVLERLTALKDSPNRYFLGRLPLIPDREHPGSYVPAKAVERTKEAPVRRAGAVRYRKKKGNDLRALLLDDPHIGPFVTVPAKENGFDIEGIAVAGERVFLGLRGPVLRGWAIVLELRLAQAKDGALKLKAIDDGVRVRKHFLDLGGLGIRELRQRGPDLMLLAGPTMDLSGPVRLYLWPDVLDTEAPAVVAAEALRLLVELPVGDGLDHPEGLAILDDAGEEILVIHDNPIADRLDKKGHALEADLYRLTGFESKPKAKPKPKSKPKSKRKAKPA